MNGHQKLLMSYPSGTASSVSFVAATGAGYIATGTTISSPSSPAGVQTGDGLFAVVMSRSAVTAPAGWTLVKAQSNTGTVTQTLSIYRKDTAATGDSSTAFVWTQASSGRMGLAYVLCRSSSGTITVAATDSATNTEAAGTTNSATLPIMTASISGELFLLAASAEVGSDTSPGNTWTASTGATLRSTATANSNRIAVETQSKYSLEM